MNECNMDLKEIGLKIAQLRIKKGLTQKDLAERVGVKREIITYWENGQRDIAASKIISLAYALDVSCDEILLGIKPEYANIYNEIGLSQQAIEAIKGLSPQSLRILNKLLSDDEKLFLSLFPKIVHFEKTLENTTESLIGEFEQYVTGVVSEGISLRVASEYDCIKTITLILEKIKRENKKWQR